jgi:hypothetical protein
MSVDVAIEEISKMEMYLKKLYAKKEDLTTKQYVKGTSVTEPNPELLAYRDKCRELRNETCRELRRIENLNMKYRKKAHWNKKACVELRKTRNIEDFQFHSIRGIGKFIADITSYTAMNWANRDCLEYGKEDAKKLSAVLARLNERLQQVEDKLKNLPTVTSTVEVEVVGVTSELCEIDHEINLVEIRIGEAKSLEDLIRSRSESGNGESLNGEPDSRTRE